MKVTLLGTGTSGGVPSLGCNCEVCRSTDPHDKRLRSAAMIETENTRILIDAGPDIRQQLLRVPFRKIDGVDVRKMDVHQLRSNIAVVLQDVFLFSDTIEENIKMGQRKELQMEAVRLAAEDAKARGFIEKMDEQYETVIGERGVGLSGGQKQRISIARALAKHSPILVLDDSTSALDMETEHEIQQTLNALRDTTKIIIAHRISAVRHADEIIYLADGKIAERGTHEELLAKKGLYYDTYMAQYGALAMSSASAGEPAPAACC